MSGAVYAAPFIIGKDQAPINQHDYTILKKVAKNAQVPIEDFEHYQRNHYIVGENGMLYWDEKKMGALMEKIQQ